MGSRGSVQLGVAQGSQELGAGASRAARLRPCAGCLGLSSGQAAILHRSGEFVENQTLALTLGAVIAA